MFIYYGQNECLYLTVGKETSGLQHYPCINCGRLYKHQESLGRHQRYECGKEPQFACPLCPRKCHQKAALQTHYKRKHGHLAGIVH